MKILIGFQLENFGRGMASACPDIISQIIHMVYGDPTNGKLDSMHAKLFGHAPNLLVIARWS